MFKGFQQRRVKTSGAEINVKIGGEGPPLLLLHGYPQTHVMWAPIAEQLAESFTVVCSDLRGYGDSSKPESDSQHQAYSKRAMALDQIEVMEALGFQRFFVAGHDRGARVTHRMALDHPDRVKRCAVIDIAPTLTMYENTDMAFARGYYHWFFLIQPADLPERMIGADPVYFLRWTLRSWGASEDFYSAQAFEEYARCFHDPACLHATCEDYRAGATIDLEHDRSDLNRKIETPLLVLWGDKGLVGRTYDVLTVWRDKADHVEGHAVPAGHFVPEEAPRETLAALKDFFAKEGAQ